MASEAATKVVKEVVALAALEAVRSAERVERDSKAEEKVVAKPAGAPTVEGFSVADTVEVMVQAMEAG